MINDYFDIIFCINLASRQDRWTDSVKEFEKHGLDVVRVEAVNCLDEPPQAGQIAKGARGCALSHAKILKMIIAGGFGRALILEDDVQFVDNLQEYFSISEKFIPCNWDMLYLGGNHQEKLRYHNGPIYKTFGTYTTGSYGITERMAGLMLSYVTKLETPVDVTYAKLVGAHNCYTFNPGIAGQRAGHSDIEGSYQDYDWHLKVKK